MNIRLQSSGKTLEHYEQLGRPPERVSGPVSDPSIAALLNQWRQACIDQQRQYRCPRCGAMKQSASAACFCPYLRFGPRLTW